MEKVGPPSSLAIDTFKRAGMLEVGAHRLTPAERRAIKAALTALPSLHRRVLLDRLDHLAFVDGIPGDGTGLTSPGSHPGHYDITLRASIISEPLSAFLTTKERRNFLSDGSGITVSMKARGTDALQYVLLHESTHVVDRTCHITSAGDSPFVQGVWRDAHTLAAPWDSGLLSGTYFRTDKRLGVQESAAVYDALSSSPFVSLYSTAASSEDFAELVAWDEISHANGELVIELADRGGTVIRRWKPLASPGVTQRFRYVDQLLAGPESHGSCADGSSTPGP